MHNKSKTSMPSSDRLEMQLQEYNFLKQKNEQLAKELAQTKTSNSNLQADMDYLLKQKFEFEQRQLRLCRMILIIDERSKKCFQRIVESSTEQAWINNTVREVKGLLNIPELTDVTNPSMMINNISSKNNTPLRKSIENIIENAVQGAEVSLRSSSVGHHNRENNLRRNGAESHRSEADHRRSEANIQEKAESPHDFVSRGGRSLPALSDIEIENSDTEPKDDTTVLQYSSVINKKLSIIDEDLEFSSSNAEEAENIGSTAEDLSSTTFFNQLPKSNVNTRRGRSKNDDNNLSINVEADSCLYQSHLDDGSPSNSDPSLETHGDETEERISLSKVKSTNAEDAGSSRPNFENTKDATSRKSSHTRKGQRLTPPRRQSFIKRKSIGSPCPRSREERGSTRRKTFSPKASSSKASTTKNVTRTRVDDDSYRNNSESSGEEQTPKNSTNEETSQFSTGLSNANRTSGKRGLSRKSLFGKESNSAESFEKSSPRKSAGQETFDNSLGCQPIEEIGVCEKEKTLVNEGHRSCLDMDKLKKLISSTPILQESKPMKNMKGNKQHDEHPLSHLARPTKSSNQNDLDDTFPEESPVKESKIIKRTVKKISKRETSKKISSIKDKESEWQDISPGGTAQNNENISPNKDEMVEDDSIQNRQKKRRKCTSYKYTPWALYEQVVSGGCPMEYSTSLTMKDFEVSNGEKKKSKKREKISTNTSKQVTNKKSQSEDKTEDDGDEISQRPAGRKRRAAKMVDYREPSLALKLRREK